MKLSLKCACGAEFIGEDSGTGYSVMVRSDNWLAMHKPCLNKPKEKACEGVCSKCSHSASTSESKPDAVSAMCVNGPQGPLHIATAL